MLNRHSPGLALVRPGSDAAGEIVVQKATYSLLKQANSNPLADRELEGSCETGAQG